MSQPTLNALSAEGNLEDYLGAHAQRDHRLGDLLRNPSTQAGTVHTPREIAQQPFLWRRVAHLMQTEHADDLQAFLQRAGLYEEEERRRPRILMLGAGTSDYVGLSLADLLRTSFRTSVTNWPTTRFTVAPAAALGADPRHLMIHFARSGNSPESKAAIEVALENCSGSTHHLVITCNAKGKLARIARAHPKQVYLVVLPEDCNDQGLAMTGSYTSMVVAGQALAHLGALDRFRALIDQVAQAGEHVLDAAVDVLYELAGPGIDRAFYLGNNDLLGAATESALKVQELTAGDVMAKSDDTLAFRHGPISAVTSEALVCFFLAAAPYTRRYELDVLRQHQSAFEEMGVRTLAFGARPPAEALGEGVTTISYDPEDQWEVPTYYQVNLAALVGQLIGLFAAYRRDHSVDDPSSSKALYDRTVQGVQLYEYQDGSFAC